MPSDWWKLDKTFSLCKSSVSCVSVPETGPRLTSQQGKGPRTHSLTIIHGLPHVREGYLFQEEISALVRVIDSN